MGQELCKIWAEKICQRRSRAWICTLLPTHSWQFDSEETKSVEHGCNMRILGAVFQETRLIYILQGMGNLFLSISDTAPFYGYIAYWTYLGYSRQWWLLVMLVSSLIQIIPGNNFKGKCQRYVPGQISKMGIYLDGYYSVKFRHRKTSFCYYLERGSVKEIKNWSFRLLTTAKCFRKSTFYILNFNFHY